jgi:carbamoyltransferase
VNTSFNMHEEPIVCTPAEAVRAFLDGGLDGLSIGPFYARRPGQRPGEESALAGTAVGSRTEGRPG